MEMTEVESSHIASYGYEIATETLSIQFKTGDIYHYKPVPRSLYDRFRMADSKGKFLKDVIRPLVGDGVKQEVS